MTIALKPRPTTAKRVWTSARCALAIFTFTFLAVALSASCGPNDVPNSSASPVAAPPAVAGSGGGVTTTASAPKPPAAPKGPMPIPAELKNLEMKTLKGETFKLADYDGKVVVLDLWASWCGPCRKEVPELIALYNDYKAKGVEVIGLTIEEEADASAAVNRFADDFKINYTVGWADLTLARALMGSNGGIPQTFVITPDGRILKRFVGYGPQVAPLLRQTVDQALAPEG